MIVKLIVATGALGVLSFVASPGIASAGEVTGSGNPIKVNANSICAFSGLEDDDGGPNGGPGVAPQSFGQVVKYFASIGAVNEEASSNGGVGIPGEECNGSTAGIK